MNPLHYIKQPHSQILLLLLFVSALFFYRYPQVDLAISAFFYDSGFYMKGSWWESILYKSVSVLLIGTIVPAAVISLINHFTGKNYLTLTPKKFAFLFLTLLLGSGIIVNLALKSHSGRARPVHVEQFQGDKQFTPAFQLADQCERNCSFASGHSSGAFFFLALAMLFRRYKPLLLLAFLYGSLVSLARIAAGGHFFSDCVTSFFIMAITADVLYFLLQPLRGDNPGETTATPAHESA